MKLVRELGGSNPYRSFSALSVEPLNETGYSSRLTAPAALSVLSLLSR